MDLAIWHSSIYSMFCGCNWVIYPEAACHSEDTKTSIIFNVSMVENFFWLIHAWVITLIENLINLLISISPRWILPPTLDHRDSRPFHWKLKTPNIEWYFDGRWTTQCSIPDCASSSWLASSAFSSFIKWKRSLTILCNSFRLIKPSLLMSKTLKICFKLSCGVPLDMM